MKFIKFEIENFKGVEAATLDLTKLRNANVVTLIGLNESGKTTILEAINSFSPDREGVERLYQDVIKDVRPEDLVPKSKKGNFTGNIAVRAFVEVSESDRRRIAKFCTDEGYEIDLSKIGSTLEIESRHEFKDSNLVETESYWPVDILLKKKRQKKYIDYHYETTEWQSIIDFIRTLIPKISYFPTFVFDFPERIYLSNPPEESDVNAYYVQIIQDILDSLPGPKMTIQTHIVNRIERAFAAEETWNPFEFFRSDKKKQIDHVMLQIGDKITQVVFDRWNDIFGVKINDKTIDVKFEIEPAKSDPALRSIYLTVLVRDGLSNFSISERSLGFRWFFCFLLFTHFRGARADINTVFLFDEPASNLHSRAQEQLLKSFSTISAGDNVIIYSTHSHYMIEPRWLEGAFIVHNDAINYDSPADEPRRKVVSTNVHVSRYREFAEKNPEKTTYFQPILDTLQYGPSKLEIGREAIFVEGKNDFYMLEYFCQLLKRESDCRFIPGVGANDLEPIISMYLGWRTNFYILLDDDGAGRVARNRYREDYFLNESQVGTLGDAAPEFAGKKFEKLLSEEGKKRIDLVLGRKASKKDLGRFFQEKAAIKDFMEFDETTLKNFEVLVDYCKKHLAK